MVDTRRVIALHGVCRYGPDWRTQPGSLGWGVGSKGYGPMVERFFLPLVQRTGCRRILLHNPFPNSGEREIPIRAPIHLRDQLPAVYGSFQPAFEALAREAGPSLEVIQYHGAATQLASTVSPEELSDLVVDIESIFHLAIRCTHSIAVDMASSLKATSPLALLLPALDAFLRGVKRRVYVEQRPKRDQHYLFGLPTFTLYDELLRQNDRGGESAFAPFNPVVENVIGLNVVPPDRDPLESWDAWIVDQVEAMQAEPHGFTIAVPIHSMVSRGRWDLLEALFGKTAS